MLPPSRALHGMALHPPRVTSALAAKGQAF